VRVLRGTGAERRVRGLADGSYRTECTYAHWVRRFLDYAAQQQGVPHPRVESDVVRDYLTHLAVRQRLLASTQNQAFCATLFLCREVLGLNVDSLSPGVRAKRGERCRSF
jgi:integrase-like protein